MIYSGKTLEEALSNAENETGIDRSYFEYEIIKNEKLFFMRKVEIEIKRILEESQVAIKNGKLIFQSGDLPCEIMFGENVEVVVNGKNVFNNTKISEDDEVQINVRNEKPYKNMSIEIDKDIMEAKLKIQYNPEKIYELEETDFQSKLQIKCNLVKSNEPEKYTKDDVKQKIKESNIKYGIKLDNIDKILNDGGICVIAEGKRPVVPINDKITLYFNKENKKTPEEIDGKVDYYYKEEILYVEKGKNLAKLECGQDGSNGINIFGEAIKIPKRETKKLMAGPGTEIIEKGTIIVSKIKGVPVEEDNKICVLPALIYNGDVDIKTGNVSFNGGDIIIKGNVKEGIKINGGSNVNVGGFVTDSEILAGSSIKVYKNVISSTLTAGSRQIEKNNAIEYIKMHYGYISKLIEDYTQLKESGNITSKINDGRIFKVLLETKFKKYKKYFFDKNDKIDSDKLDDNLKETCEDVNKVFKCIDEELLNDNRILLAMKDRLKKTIDEEETCITLASIDVDYCQNSKLNATEDINILGKGCYNTELNAGKNVLITGYPGIFRGGQITASEKVYIKEAGSKAGVLTIIKTSKEGEIEIDKVYQNTILYFGKLIYRVEEPCKMLKAFIKDNDIYIEKLKD